MQNLAVVFGKIFAQEGADPLLGPVMLEEHTYSAPYTPTGRHFLFKGPVPFLQVDCLWRMRIHSEQHVRILPTYCHWNEKSGESWYLFSVQEEKDLFLRMLECDGIGPVKALNVIARTNYTEINALIASGDRERFVKLPGIGPKTGEAMVRVLFAGSPKKAAVPTQPAAAPLNMDCVMALTALGFKRPDAETRTRKAQDALPGCEDSSQLLTAALKGK